MLSFLKKKFSEHRETRFLKKHGCNSRTEYERIYDPDYNPCATNISHYYRGYPFVYCFENRNHSVYFWNVHLDGAYVLSQWCRTHCKGKFRFDFHRVVNVVDPLTYEFKYWEIDGMVGMDYIFVAFKEERDYVWFMLNHA